MTADQMVILHKIEFKNHRREWYANPLGLPIAEGDCLITEADRGEDIGRVIFPPVNREFKTDSPALPAILRKATPADISRDAENRLRERTAMLFCNQKIRELQLEMKLVDVEYRLDRKKIVFFFTAEERIDFRELVKILASEYKTRIEMRQISSREECKKTGGIGPCGEVLCCKRFLDDFEPISTSYVKDQNLPMNPTKISGDCGKLKCCYKYEHETYITLLQQYPPYGTRIIYKEKNGVLEKIDIFQHTATLRFENNETEEVALKDFNQVVKITPNNHFK